MNDSFIKYNDNHITSNEEKDTVTKIYDSFDHTCYGSFVFGMHSKQILKWKFKINYLDPDGYMAIGIDQSHGKHINDCFAKKKGTYAYYSNGNGYNNGECIYNYGSRYGVGDIIIMNVDTSLCLLWFEIGKENKTWYGTSKVGEIKKGSIKTFKQIKIQSTSDRFTMAIYLDCGDDSISLLSFSCDSLLISDQKQDINEETEVLFYFFLSLHFAINN